MNVPYVGSESGSELEAHGMESLEEGASESFTRLESGIVVWKKKDMRDRCRMRFGSLRADSARGQARVAREREEVGDLLCLLEMPSSMITSGNYDDCGSLVLDLITVLELFLSEKFVVWSCYANDRVRDVDGALELMWITPNEGGFSPHSVRFGFDGVLDRVIVGCVEIADYQGPVLPRDAKCVKGELSSRGTPKCVKMWMGSCDEVMFTNMAIDGLRSCLGHNVLNARRVSSLETGPRECYSRWIPDEDVWSKGRAM